MNDTNHSLLELQSVSKRWDGEDEDLLHGISLELQREEHVSVVGKSGRGKTTLLRILAGLAQPSTGKVYFEGEELTGPSTEIGYVFQNHEPTVFDWLTVRQNAVLPTENEDVDGVEDDQLREWASRLGIENLLSAPAVHLSGGEYQRVAVLRTLVQAPKVILMDEPFSNLDTVTREQFIDVLGWVERNEFGGSPPTLIIVSHDIEEAVMSTNRTLAMIQENEEGSSLRPVSGKSESEIIDSAKKLIKEDHERERERRSRRDFTDR